MARIQPVTDKNTPEKSKEMLEEVKKKTGKVPNILATMAQSPATLQSYLAISGANKGGTLDAKTREKIALAVSEENNCGYCLAAHTAIGKSAGLSDEEVTSARKGDDEDPKVREAVTFARFIVKNRGHIGDDELNAVRDAGFSDAEIIEIFNNVMQSVFTNYFNHLAETDIDFPAVPELKAEAKA